MTTDQAAVEAAPDAVTLRIDAEMAEYWDGAYADSGSARDQLERFAADIIAPALARIQELTLYAASLESTRAAALAAVREGATEQANARQNASWALMCEKMVAAERERCAQLVEREYYRDCKAAVAIRALKAKDEGNG